MVGIMENAQEPKLSAKSETTAKALADAVAALNAAKKAKEDGTVPDKFANCQKNCSDRGLSRCFCGSLPTRNIAGLLNLPTKLSAPLSASLPSLATPGRPATPATSTQVPPAPKAGPPLSEAFLMAQIEAAEGRDQCRDGIALVNHWREVSKPKKQGAISPLPHGSKLDFPDLFQNWLQQRGLDHMIERGEDQQGWTVWKYNKSPPIVESKPNWEVAFHGTWWYSVWLILETGILLESNNRALGHDFWEPGVYCSPNLDTGLWYARPQILFEDKVYHRIIFELRVDPEQRQKSRQRGGVQWVFPGSAVAIHAIWVRSNAPPANGEERVNGWDPKLEALPLGKEFQEPIVNSRTGPWEPHYDEFSWDVSDNNVPPWMRGAKASPEEESSKKKRKQSWSEWQAEKKASTSVPEGPGQGLAKQALQWWGASQAQMQSAGPFASPMQGGWQPFGGSGSGQSAASIVAQALGAMLMPWASEQQYWQESNSSWQQGDDSWGVATGKGGQAIVQSAWAKPKDAGKWKKKNGATKETGVKVWLGDIPNPFDANELKEHLSQAGNCKSVSVKKGQGSALYDTDEEAQLAVVMLNGSEFGGATIQVDAWTKKEKKE